MRAPRILMLVAFGFGLYAAAAVAQHHAAMLKGGSDASNDDPFATEPPTGKKWVQTGPHVMIGGPGITKMLDTYPTTADDTRKPYVMFGGPPYEHLMMPVR
jgi:hypothetical protein